jgi:cAMP-specific phosphodiesterase
VRAVLPEWPAVDNAAFAFGKMHLLSFDLDPTSLPSDVLCHLALEMFVSAKLPAGLVEHRLRCFILAVRTSMLDNPYHNFYHVFDVMQTTNALATATGTMARLDAWERFALLSAALCHDMEHPGVTSQFLSKAAGDATPGKYKDIFFRDALLEKHHALRALNIMCDTDIGILDGLSSEQYYQFRSSVSKIILATDITRHGEYLEHLQEFAARRAENPAVEMDKQLAMEIMVKCADVSNVVKPAAVARRWALRVTDEFFLQGDAERAMGMEVSPIYDRICTSRVAVQTGFIDYLAAPLFTLLAAAFPPVRNGLGGAPPDREGLEAPLAQLRHNRALYALCSDLDLEEARDWGETASSVAPSSLRAESQ